MPDVEITIDQPIITVNVDTETVEVTEQSTTVEVTQSILNAGSIETDPVATPLANAAQADADAAQADIDSHAARTDNPHSVTKTQIGLSNVPNTDATARANHTGTQTLSTISDAGTAASHDVPASGDASNSEVVKGDDSRLTDSRTPSLHASTHQHGGSDEVATATPAANAIPKANGSGKLDAWITTATDPITGYESFYHGTTVDPLGMATKRYAAGMVTNVATASIAQTINRLKAYPLYIGRDVLLRQIGYRVAANVTNAVARVGIYANYGPLTPYPGALLYDAGNAAAATIGDKTFTITYPGITVAAGSLIWLVFWGGTAGPGIACTTGFRAFACGLSANPICGYESVTTYTSLPDPFPTGAAEQTGTGGQPIVWVRSDT